MCGMLRREGFVLLNISTKATVEARKQGNDMSA